MVTTGSIEKSVRRFLSDISYFSVTFCVLYLGQLTLRPKYRIPKFIAAISATCGASGVTYIIDKKNHTE